MPFRLEIIAIWSRKLGWQRLTLSDEPRLQLFRTDGRVRDWGDRLRLSDYHAGFMEVSV